MKQRNKWSNHSTATSRAVPEKELKLWRCLQEITITLGASRDQVKLTRALVRDLYKAIKEVKLLGEHEEESG
jgi:hypothetical protein